MATMATPKRKVVKKIHRECPMVNTPTPPSCETFLSLDRGVAMVAMVAIDDRTRIASSRRQAEAREWCTACLRVRRRGIRVSLAGYHAGRDRAARQDALVRVRASLNP